MTLAVTPSWCHHGTMDLTEYVQAVRRSLTTAAAAGGEQTRETARLLSDTIEPAVRLTVTDALAAMAAEVTAALDGAAVVDIRVRGRDPEVVVDAAEHSPPDHLQDEPSADDGATARISLRLPDALKTRAEAAAAASGTSLNTWLVRAVTTALHEPTRSPSSSRGPRRYTGFARS
jgi:hypothetical protein